MHEKQDQFYFGIPISKKEAERLIGGVFIPAPKLTEYPLYDYATGTWVKDTRDGLKQALNDKTTYHKAWKDENDKNIRMSGTIDQLQGKVCSLEDELDAVRAVASARNDAVHRLQGEISRLQGELKIVDTAKLNSTIDRLSEELRTARANNSKLGNTNCDLTNQINRLKNAVAKGNEALEKEIATLQSEIADLSKANAEQAAKIGTMLANQTRFRPGDLVTWGSCLHNLRVKSVEGDLATLENDSKVRVSNLLLVTLAPFAL